MQQRFDIRQGGLTIPCLITEPDHMLPRRVVLGIHGLCGSKEDPIQTAIAQEMGLFGYASVRFDFPAHGENPMTDGEFSLAVCQQTLGAVVEMLRRRYTRVAEFCVFASGFGAFVTLLSISEVVQALGKIRLVLQTPDLTMGRTLLAMNRITEEAFRSQGSITFPGHRPFRLDYRVYEEIRDQFSYVSLPFPILLIHGEQDDLVELGDVIRLWQMSDQAQLVVIPGAEHQFQGPGEWEKVLDLTRDWFQCEQVLLCEKL